MKTSNKILIVGLIIAMVVIAIGAKRAKDKFAEILIKPSGNIIEKTYDLAHFSKINLRDNVECTLVKADEQMVKVEMDEAWIDKLKVSVSGDEYLGFDLEGFGQSGPINVTIHYTDLSQLTVKNSTCTGEIISDSLTHLFVISGSELDAKVEAKYCNLLLQGGSDVSLKGTCNSLNTVTESGSDLEANELLVDMCTSVAKSGSKSNINVSTTLYATAESGGNISYLGDPDVKGMVAKSGGTVEKIEEGSAL